MKTSSLVRLAAGATALAATLAACSGGSPSLGPQGGLTSLSVQREAALTMPHYVARPMHPDRGTSRMNPHAPSALQLLYVSDWSTNDVDVFNFPSGTSVGTLTGFTEPYGQCVDKKGDVYIANFGAGTVVEYARGGTSVINTYSSGGAPIGCAVDAKGDLAVTSFDPGEVTVYAGGNASHGTTYSSSSCEYLWTMGYDKNRNLVGVGENTSSGIVVCEVAAGATTMRTVSFSGTIYFPGGTMWDGKYLGVGDQEAGGGYQTAIYQSKLHGATLTEVGDTVLSDTCSSNYVDVVNPFIVGLKNTPANTHQGKIVLGSNLWCYDAGMGQTECWNYPSGGSPATTMTPPPAEPYGAAISIRPGAALSVHRAIRPSCDSGV
jgi:hypothetical protein